jgi:RNA recognition motif-containing protein
VRTDLQDLFARAGTVETVKVMRDMATGRARGFRVRGDEHG